METNITEDIYQIALARIEELLPLVTDNTLPTDRKAIELKLMSDIVIDYEKHHFPIEAPSLPEVIKLRLEELSMSQRAFAQKIGVSPSRVSEIITGRSEPTLKIARLISKALNIDPAVILGIC